MAEKAAFQPPIRPDQVYAVRRSAHQGGRLDGAESHRHGAGDEIDGKITIRELPADTVDSVHVLPL